MYRVALVFCVLYAVLTATVHAEDSGAIRLSFKGTAPAVCSFSSAARSGSAQNMLLAAGANSGGIVTITEMIDNTNARLKEASIQLIFPAVCNVAHDLSLASARGALVATSEAESLQGEFLEEVRYRATARWGSKNVVLIAGGGASPPSRVESIETAQAGDMSLEINIDETDNDTTLPVLAGSYADTLTILISARL
jgi:hypothetical protein